jgi:hypothetical protein
MIYDGLEYELRDADVDPFLTAIWCFICERERVRWIPNSPHDGKDNAVWTLFDQPDPGAATRFVGRVAKNNLAVLALPPLLTEAAAE